MMPSPRSARWRSCTRPATRPCTWASSRSTSVIVALSITNFPCQRSSISGAAQKVFAKAAAPRPRALHRHGPLDRDVRDRRRPVLLEEKTLQDAPDQLPDRQAAPRGRVLQRQQLPVRDRQRQLHHVIRAPFRRGRRGVLLEVHGSLAFWDRTLVTICRNAGKSMAGIGSNRLGLIACGFRLASTSAEI